MSTLLSSKAGAAAHKMQEAISVNGRRYAWPRRPLVAICIDGCEPDYITKAIAAGRMPFLQAKLTTCTHVIADCVIPSFTNPNNLSIVTGAPPAVHGISGNYFLDPVSGKEVMMNDPALLRAKTIFAAFQQAGAKVALVTAKDKLRALLGHGLDYAKDAICFSAEAADKATLSANGIADVLRRVRKPLPSVYSADLSEFVFAAGLELLRSERPDLTYLSTTDYVQHKHAPGTPVANDFYAMIDRYLAAMDQEGALIAVSADHGMNAKHNSEMKPDIVFLEDLLTGWLGSNQARVILPITDPYVVHHGALGSYATIYLPKDMATGPLLDQLRQTDGIALALARADACAKFELPPDRVGDIVAVATQHVVLGMTAAKHDLSGLTEPLRSHGGISEQRVPLIVTAPPGPEFEARRRWRNFDLFDLALNQCAA